MEQTVTLKLQPSKEQEKTLFKLADSGAKTWNRVNYLKRQQYFQGKPVDLNKTEKPLMKNLRKKSVPQRFSKSAGRTPRAGKASSPFSGKSGMENSPTGSNQNHQTT